MRAYVTLMRRELAGYFLSLTGYVVMALTLFLVGLSFVALLQALQRAKDHPADRRDQDSEAQHVQRVERGAAQRAGFQRVDEGLRVRRRHVPEIASAAARRQQAKGARA